MRKKYMGRSPASADLVPLNQAAEILKVPEHSILSWAEKGLLEQVFIKQRSHYRRSQLEGLAPLLRSDGRTDGTVDLPTLAARADLAYAASRNTDQRLNNLLDLLGLNRGTLEMNEYAVRNLYREVENALLDAEPVPPENVREWADVLFCVDETYLLLVEQYMGTDEPWKKFLDLGYKLVVDTPYDMFDEQPNLRVTYAYLRAARDQLRMVSYFYCRERHGPRLTDRVFGTKPRVTDRIMGLLYPH